MVINRSGPIADRFWSIAHPGMPLFLLDGDKPAIFDGGLACLANVYIDHIRSVLGERTLSFCFLTHSHFDHIGSVFWLKKAFPRMDVCANSRLATILERPRAVEVIKMLSKSAEDMVRGEVKIDGNLPGFEPFGIDRPVSDGDRIGIGDGLSVEVYATPGHTRDCMSYYIPERKILIASEALGIPVEDGYIYTDFLIGYDVYIESVKKLGTLDVDVLCFGHSFVYTGEDAKNYVPRVQACAEDFYNMTARFLEEEDGDLEAVKQRVKALEYDSRPGAKQPEPAYLLNLEARILAVKQKMEAG